MPLLAIASLVPGWNARAEPQTFFGAEVYSGVYFGTFENGEGHWAMCLSWKGVPVFDFIGRRTDDAETLIRSYPYAAEYYINGRLEGATPQFSGMITGGHVEGTTDQGGFIGDIDRGDSPSSIFEGFWSWTASPPFPAVEVIAGPSGKALVAYRTAPMEGEDAFTQIDSNGEFTVTLNRGRRVSGRIDVGLRRLVVAFGANSLPPAPAGQGQLGNFSLLSVITPARPQIIQQISVVGAPNKNVLLRALGAPLAAFRLENFLEDPAFEVFDRGAVRIGANDNWLSSDAGLVGAMAQVGALPLQPGSADAAQILRLDPGDYTLVTHSFAPSASGAVLVEAFDLEPEKSQLNQLVSRGRVEANGTLVSGFVISGDRPALVLVRALGPRLADFGVSDALNDPQLKLTSSNGVTLAENNDWDPLDAALVSAMRRGRGVRFRTSSKEAAVLVSLPPGAYVASVRGSNGASGTAQIEISQPHLARSSDAALTVELFKVTARRFSDRYNYAPQVWVYAPQAATPVVVTGMRFGLMGLKGDGVEIPTGLLSKPIPGGGVAILAGQILYGEPDLEFFSSVQASFASATVTFLDPNQREHAVTAIAEVTWEP